MENWMYPLPCAAYLKSLEPQVINFFINKLAAYMHCSHCLIRDMVIRSYKDGTCELKNVIFTKGIAFSENSDKAAVCGLPLPEGKE